LLTTFPIPGGVVVPARAVALMEMNDTGEDDAKLICVPNDDRWWEGVQDAKDLDSHLVRQIKNFFETYKLLKGKPATVVTGDFKDKSVAEAAIKEGIDLYQKKFG